MKRLIKKTFLSAATLFLAACIFDSNDEEKWDASKVCPENGMNSYGIPNRGSFVDERDGQVYNYTTIGNQVWMAENLRYNAQYSMCSNDDSFIKQYCELIEHNCDTKECCKESLCNTFGRYYSIIENGDRFGSIDGILADTICPKGWHIPTKKEWEIFSKNFRTDGEMGSKVVNRVKSANESYFSISKNFSNSSTKMNAGWDNCAFALVPSGYMISDGDQYESSAFFLSLSQENANDIFTLEVTDELHMVLFHDYRNSIRCIMDPVSPDL